ncbi:hypothetical protein OPV22_004296 [Ensete ventricosum]|uniref:Uncharacterized protein n=1 Tax=Ensete ventricosum TaxID=4639 RepID=A0AAV8S3D9_ENSVE|nr:hypothetical protein OPV22_004296 [Ensete ventricosum]
MERQTADLPRSSCSARCCCGRGSDRLLKEDSDLQTRKVHHEDKSLRDMYVICQKGIKSTNLEEATSIEIGLRAAYLKVQS